jgi:hypothetical protein
MDTVAEGSVFFGDLSDRCGRKGGTSPGSVDSVWLIPSSPRGADSGGSAHWYIGSSVGSRRSAAWGPTDLVDKGGGPWVLLAPRRWSLGPHWYGWPNEFRKAPPAISIGCLMVFYLMQGLIYLAGQTSSRRLCLTIFLIKEVVLWFVSCQDCVLLDAGPHWSGCPNEFREACRLLDRMRFGRAHPYFW